MSKGTAVARLIAYVLLFGSVAIGLASVSAALIDQGPDGSYRFTLFPLALTVLDPFVWTCLWNSLAVASLVTVGSLVIGVGLARFDLPGRYGSSRLLWIFAMIPLAAGPLVMAPAISVCASDPRGWDWLAARSFGGYSLEDLLRWMSLIWLGVACHAPIVALASASALRKIDSPWIEAARAAGASRIQIWREIRWPILKPEAAKAAAAVFTLSLIEPAGPWILGLDRTLAIQILDTVRRLDEPTRATSLGLLAISFVLVARSLIHWWGGPSVLDRKFLEYPEVQSTGIRRAILGRLVMLGWIVFAVGPIVWLLVKITRSLQDFPSGSWTGAIMTCFDDFELNVWAANSATTAALAILIDLILLALIVKRQTSGDDQIRRISSKMIEAIPPLALGVGALSLPWLLGALSGRVTGHFGGWAEAMGRELDPARAPGILLILVVALGKWPMLLRVAEITRQKNRPGLVDASKLMGLSNRQTSDGQSAGLSLVPARAVVLALALAATNLSPALIMSPMSERRTIAPAIIVSIQRDHRIEPRIGLLIVSVLAGNGLAFLLASRTRVGPLGDWYRG